MNPENCKLIREKILDAAEHLKGRLPEHVAHPKGRNVFAHVPKVIKDFCGDKSYKEMPDEAIDSILALIQFCKENPF
jgi:hypothetical protein